jgi:MoaA/NifB/PqqE/SkfB family radical SAM enzyme
MALNSDNQEVGGIEPEPRVQINGVYLHVTKACNLNCVYCYFSASRPLPDEMTAEDFISFWPDLIELRPRKIVFTGGEPLLRPDILQLLRTLRDADSAHKVFRHLNTNGLLMTPELAAELHQLVDEVRVSLDAFRERNDLLRGKGSFDAAVRALMLLREAGFEPKALITVTSPMLPDLEELICYLLARGITRIKLNELRLIGRGAGCGDLAESLLAARPHVVRAFQRFFPSISAADHSSQPMIQKHCGVGGFLNIMPNGDVFPCHVLTMPEFRCGNVRNDRLIKICARSGLLGQLQDLDFTQMADQDKRLLPLLRRGACMGPVYAGTRSSSIWDAHAPGLNTHRQVTVGLVQLTSNVGEAAKLTISAEGVSNSEKDS